MTYTELETFYLDLVSRARSKGVTCAITSGMACVHYGVAQTTKDCDLLCDPEAADTFLDLIENTRLKGVAPIYRGNLSPPMDKRWLIGGWTSHFYWPTPGEDGAYLDVFGIPPRASSPWQNEIEGFYSGRHTVAEMKRTDRDKDWPFATALGEQMLEAGNPKGWLHIFSSETLISMQKERPIPPDLFESRPVLRLLKEGDSRLRGAIHAERVFWSEVDRARISVIRAALRPYVVAVRKFQIPKDAPLREQHEIRVQVAESTLALNPLRDFGIGKIVDRARGSTMEIVRPELCEWLPDAGMYFIVP